MQPGDKTPKGTSPDANDAPSTAGTNRLAREASPYLQQHARNPVDWYPWGPEAFADAKRFDKPILLSIGYSACHWCHVMERESFEDERTAALMNLNFVNVKVDREERPDLDQIYQIVVQLMGRSGGWPLTVFLTPDQKPFFGGTYFPPADRYGMPGFSKLLLSISEAYRARRTEVDTQADDLADAIAHVTAVGPGAGAYEPGPDLLARASTALSGRFDDTNGGFGTRPKFPSTMALDVLLRRGALENDTRALGRVRRALDGMRAGGIYDQLGGGFHRYSTDERWLVPHFEKMLYDNALLVRLYADAYRATGEPHDAQTVREVAAYVVREMTDPEGGFYATQDADSEGEEGKFFVWTPAEIAQVLVGDDEAIDVATRVFGVTPEGNFEESGASVLSEVKKVGDVAIALGRAPSVVEAALARAKGRLLEARETREKPFRDEKILASWNGLMIGALADAAGAIGEPSLLAAAERAFAFVRSRLFVRDGESVRVMRHVKGDVVKGPGFLDDYAFMADAALDLYEATGNADYAFDARTLADAMVAHFFDPTDGDYFFTPDDGETLIHRAKDAFDHAIPSGTSIACKVMLRLGGLMDAKYTEYAERALQKFAPSAVENPFGMSQSVSVLDRLVRGSVDVVIVGPSSSEAARALASTAQRAYMPNRTIAWVDPANPRSGEAAAVLAEGKPGKAAPAAYVCRGRTCSLPVETPAELEALLRG